MLSMNVHRFIIDAKGRQGFWLQGETVYTFCDLTHNSKDESEPDKTIQVEQPGVI